MAENSCILSVNGYKKRNDSDNTSLNKNETIGDHSDLNYVLDLKNRALRKLYFIICQLSFVFGDSRVFLNIFEKYLRAFLYRE